MIKFQRLKIYISIHAPIRGRPGNHGHGALRLYFNPRPHTGATRFCIAHHSFILFQSTPPYGGDLMNLTTIRLTTIFQSTPPYGGDLYGDSHSSVFSLFQSTPPYGGDRRPGLLALLPWYFNPRPHTGATGLSEIPGRPVPISIHAPIRGRLPWPVPVCR